MSKVIMKKEITFTDYYWGDMSELAGAELEVIEESVDKKSLLCYNGKGLVDVDKRDVETTIHRGVPFKMNVGTCEYCGREEQDLRPYGKNGANICFDCGMKPDNQEETARQFEKSLTDMMDRNGVDGVIIVVEKNKVH